MRIRVNGIKEISRVTILLGLMQIGILLHPVQRWQDFETNVRDGIINKDSARHEFQLIRQELKASNQVPEFKSSPSWIFPLQGYSRKDAGRNGFRPDIRYESSPIKGYDFYDGNLHGGHPGYDIFIKDKNFDCLDDLTRRSVHVVAPTGLFILSTNQGWQAGSELRGGNYVWSLDPSHDRLYYFAHLDSITVTSGEFCVAGKMLGTVGRTGTNAFPHRSPTHLHMMILTIDGSRLIPYDFWNLLQTARTHE